MVERFEQAWFVVVVEKTLPFLEAAKKEYNLNVPPDIGMWEYDEDEGEWREKDDEEYYNMLDYMNLLKNMLDKRNEL